MTTAPEHITICICTYKRPELLMRLLKGIGTQRTDGRFTFSVVIIDNDSARSAESTASAFQTQSGIAVKYVVEPRQNIALARNRAVENACGDYVAFIDDDEFPTETWLLTLFATCKKHGVDGVLGPVKPHFDQAPPEWVVKGNFYNRVSYPTGLVIDWKKGRTGNVLMKIEVLASSTPPFNPEFKTGEDQDFFGRMIDKGYVFIWCDEALAYEVVPPLRWNRRFMVKRALLSGAISQAHPSFKGMNILKSIIAVPTYVAGLPFAFLLGQHRFMACLIRLCDHLGSVLALMGIQPIKEPYVTS